jgi:hypothetical protein
VTRLLRSARNLAAALVVARFCVGGAARLDGEQFGWWLGGE